MSKKGGADEKGNNEEILCEGPLEKRASLKLLGWHTRFFQLTPTKLMYFRSTEAAQTEGPRGRMKLRDITSLDFLLKTPSGKRCIISIGCPSGEWLLRCLSEVDFHRWKAALEQAMPAVQDAAHITPKTPASPMVPANPIERVDPPGDPSQLTSVNAMRASLTSTNRQAVELKDRYAIVKEIDRGCNGSVFEGTDLRTGERVAIKEVDISVSSEDENQLEVWQQLHHENVVRLLDFFKKQNKLYFVMELATGRDLFYGVMQRYHGDTPKGYGEADAIILVRQIMTALRHLHLRRIVHCDLKPENILMVESPDVKKMHLKLADWGYAQIMGNSSKLLTRFVGTLNYMAPEILQRRPFNEKADIWSAGVITFILLCGFPPYDTIQTPDGAPNLSASLKRIASKCHPQTGEWASFPDKYWNVVSEQAKDCVAKMLTLQPEKRLSAEEILAHPWLASAPDKSQPKKQLTRVMRNMREFNSGRSRYFIEHTIGAVLQRTRHGSAIASLATADQQMHILEEEGWQPLISLGWSRDAEDQLIAANAFANISLQGEQALVLVREGGLRLLLQLLETEQDDIVHNAAVALSHLSLERRVHSRMVKGDAAPKLVKACQRASKAIRYQAARSLARLCLDVDCQQSVVQANGLPCVIELAAQDEFETMRADALRSIRALIANPELHSKIVEAIDEYVADPTHSLTRQQVSTFNDLKEPDSVIPEMARQVSVMQGGGGDNASVPQVMVHPKELLRVEDFESEVPPHVITTRSGSVERMTNKNSGQKVAVKFIGIDMVPANSRSCVLDEVVKAYSVVSQPEGDEGDEPPAEPTPVAWQKYLIHFHGAFYDSSRASLGIVTDFVNGISLRAFYTAMSRDVPAGSKAGLSEKFVASISRQVLRGLAVLHSRRVIHRDLKPSSLLIDESGTVHITSLGNVKRLTHTKAQAQTMIGAQSYMAPERIMGVGFSSTVDVWAVGVLTLEAFLGRFPFASDRDRFLELLEEIINGDPVKDALSNVEHSPEFESFVRLCLTKKGTDRPSAAKMLQHPFLRHAEEGGVDAQAEIGEYIRTKGAAAAAIDASAQAK